MQTFVFLTFACLLAFANAQSGTYGCNVNIPAGSPVFINSTFDYDTFSPCTALPGIIFGSGNLTGNLSLPNLKTVLTTTGSGGAQAGIQILGAQASSITFPALTTYSGSFIRVINNPNLVTFTFGGSGTVVTNGYTASGTQVVIQSNPVLVNPVINIDSLGSNTNSIVTIGADTAQTGTRTVDATGATGTVSFPFLTTAFSLTIFSNGINGGTKTLAVSLPAITSLASNINAVGNDYLTALTVGSSTTGFSLGNGGLTLQTNNFLNQLNLNGLSALTGSIRIDTNGNAGNPLTLQLDNVQYTRGLPGVSINVQNNAGLSSFSMAKLTYPTSGITISNNAILTNVNLPGPIITSFLTFNQNGGSSAKVNALLGVQNTTGGGGVAITNNFISSLAFPQAFYFTQLNIDASNTITGPIYANTTFIVATTVTLNAAAASQITRLDLSGLSLAGSITSNALTGSGSGAVILFTQLQQVTSSFQVSGATGFDSISFGKLVNVGSVSFNNNGFTTYDFLNSATNKWSTSTISLTGTNMATINFGNLVTADTISITINSPAALTITANQLTCLNQLIVNTNGAASLSGVVLGSSSANTLFNAINVATGVSTCTVTVGSASTPCNRGCFTCPSYSGGANAISCGDNVKSTTVSGQCASNANALTSSSCGTASPFVYGTTTGATLLTPPTQTGGGGSSSTATTRSNTLTSSNNPATTTDTNANGSGGGGGGVTNTRNTGAGAVCAASVLVLASAVALVL